MEWGESPISVVCKLLLRKSLCTEIGPELYPCVNLPALWQAWKETLGFNKTTTNRVTVLSSALTHRRALKQIFSVPLLCDVFTNLSHLHLVV